ncbi:MAG: energy transducer TonB [Burkholderiales bacterium]|nr:energy transducer TonB [Burkholderiales bacterium]
MSSPSTFADRMLGIALALSIALHGAFLLVHFKAPDKKRERNFTPPLEVVLVNSKSAVTPPKADTLAQTNLDGGGNTDAKRRAKSPLPAQPTPKPKPEPALNAQSKRVEQLEKQAKKLMTQVQAKPKVEQPEPKPEEQPEKVEEPKRAVDLIQRSMEIARLEAQINKDWDNYQQRPKRKFIGARTKEFRFARYVEDWRAKVERIGNLNYPDEARRDKIKGSLQLTVSIRADGSVEYAEINRSSGHKLLDSAALRVIQLATPFAAFPADISRDTDIVVITRTWTFTRADQLQSE